MNFPDFNSYSYRYNTTIPEVKIIPENESYCPIDLDPLEDPVITPCNHIFSGRNIRQWLSYGNWSCPVDRKPLFEWDLKPIIIQIQKVASQNMPSSAGETTSNAGDMPKVSKQNDSKNNAANTQPNTNQNPQVHRVSKKEAKALAKKEKAAKKKLKAEKKKAKEVQRKTEKEVRKAEKKLEKQREHDLHKIEKLFKKIKHQEKHKSHHHHH